MLIHPTTLERRIEMDSRLDQRPITSLCRQVVHGAGALATRVDHHEDRVLTKSNDVLMRVVRPHIFSQT